jgi:hypothetical protein
MNTLHVRAKFCIYKKIPDLEFSVKIPTVYAFKKT